MRIIVALLSAAAILALTWVYQQTLADAPRTSVDHPQVQVTARYRIAITATFDAGVDPFAEVVDSATSLSLSHLGQPFFTVNRPVAAGETVETELEMALPPGRHEFLVEMSPANASELKPKAVQVALYRDDSDQPIQSQVLWADAQASLVVGSVFFDVAHFQEPVSNESSTSTP